MGYCLTVLSTTAVRSGMGQMIADGDDDKYSLPSMLDKT
jgi:hypothetical protein